MYRHSFMPNATARTKRPTMYVISLFAGLHNGIFHYKRPAGDVRMKNHLVSTRGCLAKEPVSSMYLSGGSSGPGSIV